MFARLLTGLIVLIWVTTSLGCVSSFGETTYPTVFDEELVGRWVVLAGSDDPVDETVLHLIVDVHKADGAEGGDSDAASGEQGDQSVTDLVERLFHPDRPKHLCAVVVEYTDEATGEVSEYKLDAQLVETAQGRYITLQASQAETGFPFDLAETPLQYTFRIERDRDLLKLWSHRIWLVWTPIPFASPAAVDEINIDDEEEATRLLVPDFDDVIRFYADSDEADWSVLVTAKRAR